MKVLETVSLITRYVREGEWMSCPYLIEENGAYQIAAFTFFASGEKEIMVYGYGQVISSDGMAVHVERKGLFESEEECLAISDVNQRTILEREKLYGDYYEAVSSFLEALSQEERKQARKKMKETFGRIVYGDATALYQRICPDYLAFLAKES